MKTSIASVCLSGDLRQKIEAAAHAGFDGIEIFENDLMLCNESPAAVRRMAEACNVNIVALQPFRDFESMPATQRRKNFDRAERKFDLMEALGTDTLLVCSNVSAQCIDDFNRAVDDFSELAELAASRQYKIGYEALAWGRHIRDYDKAWKLVKQVDKANLGIILDSFHIFARRLELTTISEIPGDRITLVQISDAPQLDMDVLQWSRHYRCFPGQGEFPTVEFMKAICRSGYDGYISHEIFNDGFRSFPCKPTAIDGMRSLLWLEEQLAHEEPDLVSPGVFSSATSPPPVNLIQIEFVEFAAEEGTGHQIAGLLESLGFAQTHRHRSKDVKLYRLGDVSIVINEEPDSYAQHYFLLHGTSVCAVAYLSNDAQGIAERALHFGYSRFEGNIESGELRIPAVKGVGGELMYFVQQDKQGRHFFDVDFVPVAGLSSSSTGVGQSLRFDHISSGVAESEFLSTSLLYRVLLGLDIGQPQDLIDPHGIVISRTATSQDKKVRLPFNMSRSFGASTERFRAEHNGSGVQHIALVCDDIVSFVQQVSPEIVLPVPQNYYDDLEARFDLETDMAAELRQHNLLYDQNETGDYIHFYTRSVNGLFFEIVQRNHYSNYGEVNAQVRLAAQARLGGTDSALNL